MTSFFDDVHVIVRGELFMNMMDIVETWYERCIYREGVTNIPKGGKKQIT